MTYGELLAVLAPASALLAMWRWLRSYDKRLDGPHERPYHWQDHNPKHD